MDNLMGLFNGFDAEGLDSGIKMFVKHSPNFNFAEKKSIAELFDPLKKNRTGLIFIVKYESGYDLIIYDYEKNKDYFIVNLDEEAPPEYIYKNDKLNRQKPLFAGFMGTLSAKLPEVLIIPEGICGVPVTEIYTTHSSKGNETANFLRMLSVPKYAASFGEKAFEGCGKLKCVLFSNGPTTFNKRAFSGCQKLEKIFFPYSPVIIRDNAFTGLDSIKRITIPNYTQFDVNLTMKTIFDAALCSILDSEGYYCQGSIPNNPEDTISLYKFDVKKIVKNWENTNVVFDETGTEKLRWKEFFKRWTGRGYGLCIAECGDYESVFPEGPPEDGLEVYLSSDNKWVDRIKMIDPQKMNVNVVIGEDAIIYKHAKGYYPLVVFMDEPKENQVSLYDITGKLKRTCFPFASYLFYEVKEINGREIKFSKEMPTDVIVAKSKEEHIVGDRSNAEDIIDCCFLTADEKVKAHDYFTALQYLKFAKHFMESRPELFSYYSKYSLNDISVRIKNVEKKI